MCLQDGHLFNVIIQENSQMKWCDIGSIIDVKNEPLQGIREFITNAVYPLLLRNKAPSAGNLMRISTIQDIHDSLILELSLLDRHIIFSTNRHVALDTLQSLVESIKLNYQKTAWMNYFAIPPYTDTTRIMPNREKIFDAIIKGLAPKTAIDIGSNLGLFSIKAAEAGAEVLAVDTDEAALTKLYTFVRDSGRPLSIKTMVAGFGDPLPKPAELVIALALTHHLYISQMWSWAYIAEILAQYTTKHVLTEFMPNGLCGTVIPTDLSSNYTLEAFKNQLLRFFDTVEIIDYETEGDAPRIFLLGKNKKLLGNYDVEKNKIYYFDRYR
jgi:hypothetical protein